MTRRAATMVMMLSLVASRATKGQSDSAAGWNDAPTRALVELAIRRRAEQLADTGLVDYRTTARGYVTFLAQMGDGFLETPKLVKTDQLALEVYWHAPNQSKQRIIGRRDTLLLPTDIQYHRDHLGIVQNNFPDFIRIGDGDEVRDVPHPLSSAGLQLYDYRVGDTIRIQAGAETLHLIEVKVRPKDDRAPRVIGAVFLEPAAGQVVRMAFNFTHASFLDKQLEDLAIVLENRLVAGRFWLPSRQQIEIRRTGTWLDFPVRGIIRGWWEIGDYEFNLSIPQQVFAGPEITFATPAEIRSYPWGGKITDSLPPDVLMTVDPDIQKVQAEARALVQQRALERVQAARLSAKSVSDFVRFNRVEGLSIGAGSTERLGSRFLFVNDARFGFADHTPKGSAELRRENADGWSYFAFARNDLAELSNVDERSGVFNSLASQEFGSDVTDLFSRTSIGGGVRAPAWSGRFDATLRFSYDRDRQANVHAVSASGILPAAPQISPMNAQRVSIDFAGRPTELWGGTLRLDFGGASLEVPGSTWYRLYARADQQFVFSGVGLKLTGYAARQLSDRAPLQELVYFGGPTSLPGYSLHDVAGRNGIAGRVEGLLPIPFVPVPLGRFGRIPASAHLAPFIGAAHVGGSTGCVAIEGRCPSKMDGFYPTVGVGLLTFFDMLRFDVARGLKGGGWTFNIDVNRSFWSIL